MRDTFTVARVQQSLDRAQARDLPMASNNWPSARNLRPIDDRTTLGGFPPLSAPYATNYTTAPSALRNGVNSNFVPGVKLSHSTDSTSNGNMSYSTARTSNGIALGSDSGFDSEYISRRPPPGRSAYPTPSYKSGVMDADRDGYQGLQQHGGSISKRGSFGSDTTDATFATQAQQPHIPALQNYPPQAWDPRNTYNPPRGYTNSAQQARHGNGNHDRAHDEDDIGAPAYGMGNLRIDGMSKAGPSPRRAYNFDNLESRYLNNVHNDDSGAAHSGRPRNDSRLGRRQEEGRSRELAIMITKGQCEDPFDHAMRRLTEHPKLANPTLGPARFKDSKVFATLGEADDPNAAASSAVQPQMQAVVPAEKKMKMRPDWLDLAMQGLMVPSIEEAFDALPLGELCRNKTSNLAGVVRIKDIPYGTTRQEMTAFIGRNAQILRQPEGSPYHAVHILMERESGKTMDCFIEVTNPKEAAWVARQFGRRVEQKRPPKGE